MPLSTTVGGLSALGMPLKLAYALGGGDTEVLPRSSTTVSMPKRPSGWCGGRYCWCSRRKELLLMVEVNWGRWAVPEPRRAADESASSAISTRLGSRSWWLRLREES
ncbi:hypothetical protein B0T11DRAFT_281012 [Plectosphaerella cucumerina]|uniref:Uncharacterized protein n=1 Tax=Plectosphaerella cucumerina TaxID=40658 RepID=A0A8K0X3B4_9PEZI|nr:hypothetical protein B0T11DRAFT_281012 [Plectosphaerella cucumerina]